MIFWVKFFFCIIIINLFFFNIFLNNLMSSILISEFIITLTFFLFLFNSLIFNLNWLHGFSFIIVILGGMEVALGFLLLNI